MSEKITLEEILAVYNSITPSRRRWVRNRNELRNGWKELYKVLELASERDGGKVVVFDKNWHEVGKKGSVTGAINKDRKTEDDKPEVKAEPAKKAEPKKTAKK